MQRMIHKPLGGWTEAKEGQSSTHILLDKEEYEALLKTIEEADQKARLSEHNRKSSEEYIQILHKKRSEELAEAGRQARVLEARYKQELATAKAKTTEAQKELLAANEELEVMSKKNENLLRICRERSNAARHLPNKKTHTGYAVLTSKDVDYKWREVTEATQYMIKKEYVYKKAKVWETVIQTPWPSCTDVDTLREQIEKDLLTDQQLTAELGMTGYQMVPAEMVINNPGNILFQMDIKNNYQRGYWEVILRHTKSLGLVPEHMDFRKLQKEQKEKREQDQQAKPEQKKKKKKVERVKAAAPVEAKSVAPKEEEKKEEKKAFYDDTDEILRFLGVLEE